MLNDHKQYAHAQYFSHNFNQEGVVQESLDHKQQLLIEAKINSPVIMQFISPAYPSSEGLMRAALLLQTPEKHSDTRIRF